MERLETMVEKMRRESNKEPRFRDSRVYASTFAVVETFGLMLNLKNPSDPDAVIEAVREAVDIQIEIAEFENRST